MEKKYFDMTDCEKVNNFIERSFVTRDRVAQSTFPSIPSISPSFRDRREKNLRIIYYLF
jgi:hypothetical protein